jgi:hypothetical protein
VLGTCRRCSPFSVVVELTSKNDPKNDSSSSACRNRHEIVIKSVVTAEINVGHTIYLDGPILLLRPKTERLKSRALGEPLVCHLTPNAIYHRFERLFRCVGWLPMMEHGTGDAMPAIRLIQARPVAPLLSASRRCF